MSDRTTLVAAKNAILEEIERNKIKIKKFKGRSMYQSYIAAFEVINRSHLAKIEAINAKLGELP